MSHLRSLLTLVYGSAYSRSCRHPVTSEADECPWGAGMAFCCRCSSSVICFCLTVSSTVLTWAATLIRRLSRQFCAALSVLRSWALVNLYRWVSRNNTVTSARAVLASAICCSCFCRLNRAKASLPCAGVSSFF